MRCYFRSICGKPNRWVGAMPKLILSMDGLVLKEIELDKERT